MCVIWYQTSLGSQRPKIVVNSTLSPALFSKKMGGALFLRKKPCGWGCREVLSSPTANRDPELFCLCRGEIKTRNHWGREWSNTAAKRLRMRRDEHFRSLFLSSQIKVSRESSASFCMQLGCSWPDVKFSAHAQCVLPQCCPVQTQTQPRPQALLAFQGEARRPWRLGWSRRWIGVWVCLLLWVSVQLLTV